MRAAQTDFYDVLETGPRPDRRDRHRASRSACGSRRGRDDPLGHRTSAPSCPTPSFATAPTRPGEVVAMRWIGHEPTDEITAILNASRTKTPQDFRAALKTFALPAQNFVYADATGNIAQFTASCCRAARSTCCRKPSRSTPPIPPCVAGHPRRRPNCPGRSTRTRASSPAPTTSPTRPSRACPSAGSSPPTNASGACARCCRPTTRSPSTSSRRCSSTPSRCSCAR